MQIPPSAKLTSIIKHYLFLNSSGFEAKTLRIFSDGNMGIVFTSGNNLSLGVNKRNLPNSFLYGQITQFRDLRFTNTASLVIVVFQPAGLKKLLGITAPDLRDNIFSLEEIFGKEGIEIEERLAAASTIQRKSGILNAFFTLIAAKISEEKEPIISASINFILKNKGLTSNSQLVKLTGYTERHIERLFMESIGINPKSFANIIKLHNFLQQLKNKPGNTALTKIVYDAGYADQSHLIREFKKHTGMTPRSYANNSNKLAINFVAMPY